MQPVWTDPFLALPGAVAGEGADAGLPAHYGEPIAEQRLIDRGAVVDLSNRGVIAVTGPDRLTWLDSMFTQALAGLAPGQSAETLLLDPNGRVEHEAAVVDDGDTVRLIVEASEREPLTAFLDRMRFRLRVDVVDETDRYAVLGDTRTEPGAGLPVAAPAGTALIWRDPWPAVAVGGVRYATGFGEPWRFAFVLVPRDALDAISASGLPIAGTLALEAARVAAWRPRFASEVDDRSIPHELDWLSTAVHLEKGCFRGQETIAKVHNLGHPPRRLVLLQLDGSQSLTVHPGDEVTADGTPVGRVTSAALHIDAGPIALAVVKRSVPVDAALQVVTDDGSVAAAQETIVPPEAGAAVNVPLRRRR